MSSERRAAGVPPLWVLWIIGPCVLAALMWLLYPIVTGARVASNPQPQGSSPAARNPAASPASSAGRAISPQQSAVGSPAAPHPVTEPADGMVGGSIPPQSSADHFESKCEEHVGYCVRAIFGNARRNQGTLLSVADWAEVVCPGGVTGEVAPRPSYGDELLPHYAINAAVAGRRLDGIASPETTVLLYESDQDGTPVFTHRGGALYAFVDGHVAWLHKRDRPGGIRTSAPTTKARDLRTDPLSSDEAREACISNLKQLALSHHMYMQDHDETMTPHPNWSTYLLPYYKNEEILRCPADRADARLSYDMNAEVAGIHVADVKQPARTFLLYEVDESGHLVLRHDGGANYAFMDGHVRWYQDPPEDSGLVAREEER